MYNVALLCRIGFRHFNKPCLFTPFKLPIRISSKPKLKLLIGFLPLIPRVSAQSEIKTVSNETTKTQKEEKSSNKDEIKNKTEKTPWERVCAIYEYDEFGNLSKEFVAVTQSTFLASFVGFIYGGVKDSRVALHDFIERNQATMYEHPLDAKKRLQNHVTVHFGKGALRWGLRLSVFTGSFMLFIVSLAAYRGHYSVIDYVLSGTLVGAVLRSRLGPQGMIAGGTVGCIMGLICGLSTAGLLSLTGTSHDDILSLQYELQHSRTKLFNDAVKQNEESKEEQAFKLLKTRETSGKDEKL